MARTRRISASNSATTNTGTQTESQPSVQEEIFRSLLRTAHRQADDAVQFHKTQFERDPNFYGKLAYYAAGLGNCAVRDTNEIMIAVLFASPYRQHQEAAYVMLQDLPPYQVERVMQYVTGHNEIVRYVNSNIPYPVGPGVTVSPLLYSLRHHDESLRGKPMPRRTVKLNQGSREYFVKKGSVSLSAKSGDVFVDSLFVKHAYLNKRSVRGMLRKAIRSYLRYRESSPSLMEGALMRAKSAMRRLYRRTNTLPCGDEASEINQYLFHNKTLPGSRLHALRLLRETSDPIEMAKIIMDSRLPFVQITSMISDDKVTPTIMVAMAEIMSPQELMQNLSWFQKHGAMNNSELKSLIESKLAKAKTAKKTRIDAMKGSRAAKIGKHLDADIQKAVRDVTDAQIKHHGQIRCRTALLIDKSGSMDVAIEIGKQIGAAIAQACATGNPPVVYMFDTMPTPIIWSEKDGDISTKSAWDKKLEMFKGVGGTVPATVIRAMISSNIIVDQIVVVTDEEENTRGGFASALVEYKKQLGVMPNVVIVRVSGSNYMETSLKENHIPVDVMPCNKIDDIALPNLIQLLSRKSVFDLVQEILALDLPSREDWDNRHLRSRSSEQTASNN